VLARPARDQEGAAVEPELRLRDSIDSPPERP